MRAGASALAAVLFLACVTPPLGGDYARLEGTWVVTYNEAWGAPMPERKGALFVFRHDQVRRSTDAQDQRFTLDESVTPKQIDFHGEGDGEILGIYRLEGDELVICTNGGRGARPTEFRTALYPSGTILTRFTRRK